MSGHPITVWIWHPTRRGEVIRQQQLASASELFLLKRDERYVGMGVTPEDQLLQVARAAYKRHKREQLEWRIWTALYVLCFVATVGVFMLAHSTFK